MIKEGRKLPALVTDRIPFIIEEVSKDSTVVALISFGSLAKGALKPLSDLDFAVLVSNNLDPTERFEKHLNLIGLFNQVFKTDEIDLVLLNDIPIGFSLNIIFSGRLLYCSNRTELIDFMEKTVKFYLDFKFFRDEFDRAFLEGIGYHG
jgi:predicted nucleotidyltransferase